MRPLGVGEVLDAAIKLVRRHFKALALVTLLVSVPIAVLSGLITAGTTDFCHGPQCANEVGADDIYTYDDDVAYGLGQVANALLSIVQALVVQVACFRILAEGYLGRDAGAGESMRFALQRGGRTLWLGIVLVCGLVLAFLALVIPAIWLGIAWSLAVPVLLVEGLGGTQALKRSFELVRGHWWATFLRLLVAGLLLAVGAAAAGALLAVLLLFAVDEASYAGLALNGVVGVLVQTITTPFLAAVTVLVYFDLRVRKEGFDLALLAERLGGGSAVEAAPAPAAGGNDAFGRPAREPGASSAPDPWALPPAPHSVPPPSQAPPPPRSEPPDLGDFAPPEPGRPHEP